VSEADALIDAFSLDVCRDMVNQRIAAALNRR
jgi:hypothetical protein